MVGSRVYVGGLPFGVRERDLEKFFKGFGRTRDILIKNGYGFVEFEDHRDADDAVYELNGKDLLGERVVVEAARGIDRGDRYRRDRDRYSRDRGPLPLRPRYEYRPPTRTEYRLTVENLSSRISWQDLKDYMRQAGEVTYADAHKQHRNEGGRGQSKSSSNTGVVEFATHSDMRAAIEKLDNTELNGRRIRLVEDRRSSRRRSRSSSRSRSRSRSRRRTRSRSRSRRSSRSRSRSKSKSKKSPAAKSRSRSKSAAKPAGSRSRSRSKSAARRSRSKSPARRSRSKSAARRSRSKSAARRSRSKSAARRSRSKSAARRTRSKSGERRSRSKSPARRSRSASKSARSQSRSPRKSVSRERSQSKEGSATREAVRKSKSASRSRSRSHSRSPHSRSRSRSRSAGRANGDAEPRRASSERDAD